MYPNIELSVNSLYSFYTTMKSKDCINLILNNILIIFTLKNSVKNKIKIFRNDIFVYNVNYASCKI